MNKTAQILSKIEMTLLIVSISVVILGLLPGFTNPLNSGKLVLATISVGLLFIVKSVRKAISGDPALTISNFDIPVLLVVFSFVLSSLLATPNKLESFWLPGNTSFIIIGAFLYFAVTQLSLAQKRLVSEVILILAAIIAIFSLIGQTGILTSITALPTIFRVTGFNPAGSILSAAILMIMAIPLAIDVIVHGAFHKKAIYGTAMAFIGLGLLLNVFSLLQPNRLVLPGFGPSWVVATESLKRDPVLGVGPGNYLSAFSSFLPLSYNSSTNWSTRFGNAQNFYFSILTENGLVGIAAILLFVYVAFKTFKSANESSSRRLNSTALITLLVILALFPTSPVLSVMLMVVAGLSAKTHTIHFGVNPEQADKPVYVKAPLLAIAVPTVLLVCVLFFFGIKFVAAETTYNKALVAVGKNDARAAYDLMREAINTAPYVDRYHITYSQLNLALANAVAQKKDLTTEDRNTIARLIQQSIREGKVAVALNNERSGNWEVLASIYRAVMPLAQGADQFAVQSYSQAIALDPTNPNLRIALGGIFYKAKRYDDAIDIFKLAVVAHPRHANARYNLALAYREAGQFERALNEMNQLITLLPQDSSDYKVAQKEIENLKLKQPKKDAASGENLTPPATGSEEELDPKIELPEDATPPATTETPTVSPTPIPTATPVATP